MLINRDMKAAIVRPTKAYLQKTSLFLRYRIAAHKNLLRQLFSSAPKRHPKNDRCLFTYIPELKEREDNITAMFHEMEKRNLFPDTTF